MTITLRPITPDNFHPVISLKVAEGQTHFVAANVYSIAQASLYPDWHPRAVYAGETLVGFVMWGIDHDQPTPEWWIIRLMIAAEFQGKGYGKAATLAALEALRAAGAATVFLSFEPENDHAAAFYRRLGFQDTGRVEYGEIVYSLALDARQQKEG